MPTATLTPPERSPEAKLIDPCLRVVRFVVPGKPVTWARMRHGPNSPGFIAADRRAHMGEIRRAWQETREDAFGRYEALTLEALFVFGRSPSHFKKRGGLTASAPRWPGKNLGDLDNLEKIVKDSLNTVAYHDDSQIQRVVKDKRFAEGDEMPCSILVLKTR